MKGLNLMRPLHCVWGNRRADLRAWLAVSGLVTAFVLLLSTGAHAALIVDAGGNEPPAERFMPTQVPGDANGDGRVDKLDAAILATYWGTIEATWEMGDFDGDGRIGPKDSAVMAANWGFEGNASTIAVPEPTTLLIWSLLGVLDVAIARWRRRK